MLKVIRCIVEERSQRPASARVRCNVRGIHNFQIPPSLSDCRLPEGPMTGTHLCWREAEGLLVGFDEKPKRIDKRTVAFRAGVHQVVLARDPSHFVDISPLKVMANNMDITAYGLLHTICVEIDVNRARQSSATSSGMVVSNMANRVLGSISPPSLASAAAKISAHLMNLTGRRLLCEDHDMRWKK